MCTNQGGATILQTQNAAYHTVKVPVYYSGESWSTSGADPLIITYTKCVRTNDEIAILYDIQRRARCQYRKMSAHMTRASVEFTVHPYGQCAEAGAKLSVTVCRHGSHNLISLYLF